MKRRPVETRRPPRRRERQPKCRCFWQPEMALRFDGSVDVLPWWPVCPLATPPREAER
jgi:hypothetical protein